MGTRNLTMVISEGETKVAQYGQWDGYPEGQGLTVLSFLQKTDLNKFRERLKSISFFTKKELQAIEKKDDEILERNKKVKNGKYEQSESAKLYEQKPWLSRDLGAQILQAIMDGKFEGTDDNFEKKKFKVTVDKLVDQTNFAADSLFCEWLWLIDLDKNVLEAYKGFNTKPLAKNERFKYLEEKVKREVGSLSGSEYFPVRKVASFKLKSLPDKKEFLAAFEKLKDED